MSPITVSASPVPPKGKAPRAAKSAGAADFVLPGLDIAGDPGDVAPLLTGGPAKRTKLAEGGKDLPDQPKKNAKDRKADPAFAWMPVPLSLPVATPKGAEVTARATAPAVAAPQTMPVDAAGIDPEADQAGRPATLPDTHASPTVAADAAPATDPAAVKPDIASLIAIVATATPKAPARAAPESTKDAPIQRPDADPAQPAAVAVAPQAFARPVSTAHPAIQAFAAAIPAAAPEAPAAVPQRKADRTIDAAAKLAGIATDAPRPIAVKAATGSQHAPLDLRQDKGLQGMIDRIETLRDNADANDTRIRLTPAELGTVDVAVRKDGDTVHVHFAAEQSETRALLTDAQPRLAQLAEARGLKLGETNITGGGADSPRQQPQQAFVPQQAAAPRSAFTTTDTADADADADARVA